MSTFSARPISWRDQVIFDKPDDDDDDVHSIVNKYAACLMKKHQIPIW